MTASEVDAPLALCSFQGLLLSATPSALRLLERLGVMHEIPVPLPPSLWALLEASEPGDSIEWQPQGVHDILLGCTRYVVQEAGFLLLMREVSDKHRALADVMNRRRLESTGRLAASVAHDVRSSVATIVYSADFLETHGSEVRKETLRETVRDICAASRRLQLTVDGLLDYACLGPAISVPVALREVLARAQGMLRKFYRFSPQTLRVELGNEDQWLRGNPVVIEQIFVNLLLALADRAEAPRPLTVSSLGLVQGMPGQPPRIAIHFFQEGGAQNLPNEPGPVNFASEAAANAILLSDARAAAAGQGGELEVEDTSQGKALLLLMPRSEGPR